MVIQTTLTLVSICPFLQKPGESSQAGEKEKTYCKDIHRSPVGVRSSRWGSSPEEWGGGSERSPAAAACTEPHCLHYCYLEKTENTQTQWKYSHWLHFTFTQYLKLIYLFVICDLDNNTEHWSQVTFKYSTNCNRVSRKSGKQNFNYSVFPSITVMSILEVGCIKVNCWWRYSPVGAIKPFQKKRAQNQNKRAPVKPEMAENRWKYGIYVC